MYRRVRSLRRRILVIVAAITVVLAFRLGPLLWRPTVPEALAEGNYPVERVTDGGTLLLVNGAQVCLIGVSAETADVDPRAAAFVEGLLLAGGELVPQIASEAHDPAKPGREWSVVRLEFDRERVDRQGRFWAYVWVGEKLLNEELLLAGLGRANLQSRYNQSKKTRLRRAEQEAKSAARGRWGER